MKRLLILGLLLCTGSHVSAGEFGNPLTVVSGKPGVFLHFESSGRTSLAVNKNGTVGIVWEDNSSGTPQVYAALKEKTARGFSKPVQISPRGPAYEPAITSLGDTFIIGWESDNRLWLRTLHRTQPGPVLALSREQARQITLTRAPQQFAVAAWSEKDKVSYHIRTAEIRLDNGSIKIANTRPVDQSPDRKEQLYPTVTVTELGTVVGWEDRRQGATRIFTAFAPGGKPFAPYQLLNDFRYSRIRKFGQGTGAMRIVLTGDRHSRVMAVWLDKRDFPQGYDVYSAYSENGGRTFAKDEKVQDPLGNNIPQWHPTVAMSPQGNIIAAWDDTRDETPDIWFSIRRNKMWSDDDTWPGGNGEGAQTHPVLHYDSETLHIAWLERHNKRNTIRYIRQ